MSPSLPTFLILVFVVIPLSTYCAWALYHIYAVLRTAQVILTFAVKNPLDTSCEKKGCKCDNVDLGAN